MTELPCTAEYPGGDRPSDQGHIGQPCARTGGHGGPHAAAVRDLGAITTRTLTWSSR